MDLCQITGKAVNIFYDYYKYLNLDKTINITKLGGDYIELDNILEVFALKLEGYSNYQKNLEGIENLRTAFMFSDSKVRLMVTIVKTESYQGSYVFCTNRDLALSLKDMFDVKLLSDDEIINALFDSYLINDYYVDSEKRIASTVSLRLDRDYFKEELEIDVDKDKPLIPTEWDILYYKSKEIMKEATFGISENFTAFQGYKFNQKKDVTFSRLYRTDWKGAIYLYFDLSYRSVAGLTKTYKNKTRDEGGKAHEYAKALNEAVEKKDVDVCLANCLMVLEDPKDVASISNQLGIDFVKKNIGVREILAKTLLLKRDIEKNVVIRTKDIEKFIAKVHKKDSIREIEGRDIDIDFYGKDINGAYVNYVFRENSNPHAIMIAGSGSGKSFAIQKIITQILEYSVEEKISKKISKKQVRYFDVGFSAQRSVKALKENYSEYIDELSPSLDELRFNLLDIEMAENGKNLNLNDLTFKLTIFDLVLESNGTDKLNAEEFSIMKEGITHLHVNNMYKRITIYELKNIGFQLLAKKLMDMGYSEYVSIDDLKPEDSHLVKQLKMPTLNELYAYLTTKSKDITLTASLKSAIEGTIQKVNAVNSLEVFSRHPVFEFGTNNFVYFDVDKIKGDERLFAPIYMYVLMSYYNFDKEQANDIRLKRKKRKFNEIPQSYYIVEEAHNFMRYPSFQKTFDILAREARKYGVHMIFVSQNVVDIPKETLNSIATRMFMATPEKRTSMIESIKKYIGMSKEVEWTFKHILDYQILIHYDKGVFGCKLDISKEEMQLFTTSA